MEFSFLGWRFTPVRLSQRAMLSALLGKYPQSLSGFTFASLATWQSVFSYGWVLAEEDTLLISCILEPDRRRHLMQPVGPVSASLADRLVREAQRLPYPLRIVGVSEDFLGENSGFVEQFGVFEDQAASNYIYLAESLAKLPGRKYAKKRNLLAQAAGQYSWAQEPLSSSNIGEAFEVISSFQDEEQPVMDLNLEQELAAVGYTLRNFSELRQEGLVFSVKDRPVAFAVYEPINPSTVAIHFERALRSYKGLYQVVNWETAQIIAEKGYEFINREEDLGSPGLRDAKRSYNPIRIIPAYELTFKSAGSVERGQSR